ncbi:MAG: L-glutamate gamma-semialdehyde dehydrogenase [Salinivirgaceae bacterium]|nr:L-glutamate gamma-semialdehyde dehydrogenase [Salinivirgaceae bacterium]MDY0280850.1 L-glutamate gamma-semialdehyde dehydrogenase [Salinivirgaceae bacterium]
MQKNMYFAPPAVNEPVYAYRKGSPEREALIKELNSARSTVVDIPMIINGKEIFTDKKVEIHPPHDIKHLLGHFNRGNASHVTQAIEAALAAKSKWSAMPWQQRATIFLKAAAMIAGPYRARLNAATMLCQSKSAHQAEIDSACELADFLRFNVEYLTEIYAEQPQSDNVNWNRVENRALEGFVFALTPFNFTAIAGNLPSAPALMGNTVVWKASNAQIYSARIIMDIFLEAGLPDGVINLVFVSGPEAGKVIFHHPDFAGIHYTGSTEVFQSIWKEIGNNISNYKSYPRIVGETGGKNFVLVHESADPVQVATALTRGAFEYQGQKCSAASRAYIPNTMWEKVRAEIKCDLDTIKMGPVEDLSNFVNAVIDEVSFDKIAGYIERAKKDKDAEVIFGGKCDKTNGYFIEPTVILTTNPNYVTMVDELFGPVLTIYVYDHKKFEETIDLVDKTSIYGLTGSIFSKDRYVIDHVMKKLEHAAGNFYINDKPTGAVVNQQPFGGARGSGTNDKAGSKLNLLRWVSPRTIKECFIPPASYKYPFLD